MSNLDERGADPPAEGIGPVSGGPPLVESDSQAGREYARLAFLAAALVVAIVLLYLTPAREILTNFERFRARLGAFGWAAPLVFMAAVAAGVAVGVPRLVFCPVGGAVFGFAAGLFWTQLATLLGSYATFLFVRWGGRSYVLRRWPRLSDMSRRFSDKGSVPIFLVRQIPISGFWVSALLGLTHARHVDFILGTILGSLPEAIPATLIGAGASQASFGKALYYILAAIVWFVILGILVRKLIRSSGFQSFRTWGKTQGKTGETRNVIDGEE